MLSVNSDIRQAIASGSSIEEIDLTARGTGMTTLFEHGCMAVEQGHTTLKEIVRVLGLPDGC
ncbi:hypothetical protein D3C85_1805620 [compost metagenome]